MNSTRQTPSPAMATVDDPRRQPVQWAVTVRRVVSSELVKLRTLRSQVWLLVAATAFTVALGPVQSLGEVLDDSGPTIGSSADAVSLALAGATTASLLIGVLGVLTVAGEYAPRAIRNTFMLVPRRGHVVAAKALALGSVVAVTSALAVAVAVTAGLVILAQADVHVGWGSPQVLRISVAMVWYLVGWGVLGQVAGWVTGSKIGGATLLMTVMLVLAPVLGLLPGPAGEILVAVTPSSVGGAMISSQHTSALGSPPAGFVIWSFYLVLFTAVSAWAVGRRDA
jgi:ABC-2 type transport system permease protein